MTRDRHVVVLGASGGIGRAITMALVRAGWRVTAVGRRREPLDRLAEACGCSVLAGDIDDPAFRTQLLDRTARLSALVSAVGIAVPEPLLGSDPANWQRMIQTNLLSVMGVVVPVARALRAGEGGTIVIIGSVLARAVMPNAVAYAASKHALAAFTEGLRQELVGSAVRVVEIAPGLVGGTGFHRHASHPDLKESFARRPYEPLHPEDVAACVILALDLPPNAEITTLEIRQRGQLVQG